MFPRKRPEVDNTKNLDLNTTARKNEKTIEKFSPYLMNATYAVIQANLAFPIGSFDIKEELAAMNATSDVEESKDTKTDAGKTDTGKTMTDGKSMADASRGDLNTSAAREMSPLRG